MLAWGRAREGTGARGAVNQPAKRRLPVEPYFEMNFGGAMGFGISSSDSDSVYDSYSLSSSSSFSAAAAAAACAACAALARIAAFVETAET